MTSSSTVDPDAFKPKEFTYTDAEQAVFAQVKEDEEWPDWVDDKMIYRFCRARQFDFDKVVAMLQNHVQHVEDFEPWDDEKVFETPEWKSRNTYLLDAPDKFGRPILYCRPRYVAPELRTPEDTEQNFLYWLRQSQAIAKKNNTEQCVLIMDLSGWGLRNRDNATLNMQIDHLQNNYPESLGACFLCNYPWLLWPVWKVAKMWLDPKTASKVVFVEKGNNDILTSLVSPDVLPTGVGGKCEEPQPLLEIFRPRAKKGWFGGLFGGGSSGSGAESSATEEVDDDDPLAGLEGEAREKRMAEIEAEQLAEAKEIEKAAAEVKQAKRTRRKKKGGGSARKKKGGGKRK